jgi:hypothetical protein
LSISTARYILPVSCAVPTADIHARLSTPDTPQLGFDKLRFFRAKPRLDGRMEVIPFTDRFRTFQRPKTTLFVIPTKAGIQLFSGCLDSRIRGNDEDLLRIGIMTTMRITVGIVIKLLIEDVGPWVRELVRQICKAFEIRITKGVVNKDHHCAYSSP